METRSLFSAGVRTVCVTGHESFFASASIAFWNFLLSVRSDASLVASLASLAAAALMLLGLVLAYSVATFTEHADL